jgi:hypothetical protein|tara:strand:+ start:11642 stop:12391 length:750 start_codon:yes stop_codon:yes gene_type:complete
MLIDCLGLLFTIVLNVIFIKVQNVAQLFFQRAMHGLTLALLLNVIFWTHSAQAASCRYRAVSVDVRQVKLPVRLDKTHSANQLTATSGRPVAHNQIVLGHGGGGMQISGSLDFSIGGSAKDGYCPKVKNVNIELQVAPSIKIANSLRTGTCEYNAVLQHEQFHVAVLERASQDAARQIPSLVNAHLQRLYANVAAYGSNPQRLDAQVRMQFSQSLNSINQQMSAHMNSEQQKIDNPTEYARVQNSCSFR